MRLEELPDPIPGDREVLLKVRACSICGSDVLGYRGISKMRVPPLIMGHEFSGEVVGLGPNVKTAYVGERAAVVPNLPCGTCRNCRNGFPNLCTAESRRIMGVTMPHGNRQGAMAEYICVPESSLLPFGSEISYEEASLMEPFAVSLHAVKHLGDITGKTVLVFGAGPMGLLAMACAKIQGAKNIVVTDLMENRLYLAKQMGATHICPGSDGLVELLAELTDGNGADASVDCVGISDTVNQQVSLVKPGGKIVLIGMGSGSIEFALKEAICRETQVLGSYTYTTEMSECMELLKAGKVDLKPLITKVVSLQEAPLAFQNLVSKNTHNIKIVVDPAMNI